MNATAYNLEDYSTWLNELREVFVSKFSLDNATADKYVTAANWEDYYNEDYSPLEAAEEDSSYWNEIGN